MTGRYAVLRKANDAPGAIQDLIWCVADFQIIGMYVHLSKQWITILLNSIQSCYLGK